LRYDGNENELRYLRRHKNTSKFLNDANTSFGFLEEDIIAKLPSPSSVGGTARKATMLYFGVSFGQYHVE